MEFTIHWQHPERLRDVKTFITGFHGIGEVGYIFLDHCVNTLESERIGILTTSAARPMLLVDKGKIHYPFEFYAWKDILFFVPHQQPHPSHEVAFSEHLAEWILEQQFEQVILIGGVDKNLRTSDNNCRYIATRRYLEQALSDEVKQEITNEKLDDGFLVVGPLAILTGLLELKQFPALAVLAYAERMRPDPEGAIHAIEFINRLLNLDIKTEKLVENAQKIEEEIKNKLEEIKKDTEPSPAFYM